MFEQSARDPGTPVNARLAWLSGQLAAVPPFAGAVRPMRRRRTSSAQRSAAAGSPGGEKMAIEGESRLSALADHSADLDSQRLGGKAVRSWLPDDSRRSGPRWLPDSSRLVPQWWPEGSRRRLVQRWLPGSGRISGLLAHRGVLFAAALLATAAVVLGGLSLFGPAPAAEVAPSLPTARAQTPGAAKSTSSDKLVISVVGHVRAPGLVTVPSGSRVADALRAAGGADVGVDLTTLNLARKLTDGEQLAVGVPAAPAAPAGAGAAAGKIDLNSATAEQLDTLPGVGQVTARRIVDWRTQHGGFSSVEQLREVGGIGESKFQKLREQVTAG